MWIKGDVLVATYAVNIDYDDHQKSETQDRKLPAFITKLY
jgi:hypothetical protein